MMGGGSERRNENGGGVDFGRGRKKEDGERGDDGIKLAIFYCLEALGSIRLNSSFLEALLSPASVQSGLK